jgi:hypothetical protein
MIGGKQGGQMEKITQGAHYFGKYGNILKNLCKFNGNV